jgi:hypothetical protein
MSEINVESYLAQLRQALPQVPPVPVDALKALHRQSDYEGMVRLILRAMNLDVRLVVGWVNSGGPKGHEQAPAWVSLADNMPFYGTPEFKKLTLKMFVRKSFLAQSSYAQAAITIAHELSHIVLDSVRHPLRREEKAVDLTAMLLGFSELYRRGAVEKEYFQNCTNIRQLGYLSEAELDAACRILLPWRLRVFHNIREWLRRRWLGLVLITTVFLVAMLVVGSQKWEAQKAAWAVEASFQNRLPTRVNRYRTLLAVQAGLLSVVKTYRIEELPRSGRFSADKVHTSVCETDSATIRKGITYKIEYRDDFGRVIDRFEIDRCP